MNTRRANPERSALVLAFALLALLTLAMFGSRPLTVIDETRYVGVAWEMWLRGDFLVPYKNGEPYSHKPPLLFWLIHAGWWVFGVNDLWPRLVLPFFSAGGLWLTAALGQRLWPGQQLGGKAALILVASLLWALYSTAVMFDVLLAFWVLVGLHGVLDASEGRSKRGFFLIALAIACGVLAKGPVILLHLLPVACLASWWRANLRWKAWLTGWLLALAGGAVIALAWAIPAGLAGGEAYSDAIFWGQTGDRVADAKAHPRAFGWYFAMLPVLLFPWLWWPRVWAALWALLRPGGHASLEPGTRFCLAWAVPVFVVFCFIGDKQPHYVAPLVPAFALLAARALAPHTPARGCAGVYGVVVPGLLIAAIGVFLMLVAAGFITSDDLPAQPLFWPAALLVGFALACVWLARRADAVALLAFLGAGGFGLMQLSASSVFAPMYDLKPLAMTLRVLQNAGIPVANAATYHAQFQFAGRLEKPLIEIPAGDETSWLAANPHAWVVVYLQNPEPPPVEFLRYQLYKGGALVLVDAKNAAHLLSGDVSGRAGVIDRDAN